MILNPCFSFSCMSRDTPLSSHPFTQVHLHVIRLTLPNGAIITPPLPFTRIIPPPFSLNRYLWTDTIFSGRLRGLRTAVTPSPMGTVLQSHHRVPFCNYLTNKQIRVFTFISFLLLYKRSSSTLALPHEQTESFTVNKDKGSRHGR